MRSGLSWRSPSSAFFAASFFLFSAGAGGAETTFNGLGDLSGGYFYSEATGVSADGLVVVGFSNVESGEGAAAAVLAAFRWTSDHGMVSLVRNVQTNFLGVSGDGSVVVGTVESGGVSSPNSQGFRWTAELGAVGLDDPPPGDFVSGAFGVSADGSHMVGFVASSNLLDYRPDAFLWTSEGGLFNLGDLSEKPVSRAFGVAADGTTVVGSSDTKPAQFSEAFRWTVDEGMVGLGHLPGLDGFSTAFATSADGSIVVGTSANGSESEAFRWTADEGMVGLGHVPGAYQSLAYATSGDGSVVVGFARTASGPEAFVWRFGSGMRSLSHELTRRGADLTGWTLTSANAISADGSVIVGSGINPSGYGEAWRAVVPEVDTNSMSIASLVALLLIARRTRRRTLVTARGGWSFVTDGAAGEVCGNDQGQTPQAARLRARRGTLRRRIWHSGDSAGACVRAGSAQRGGGRLRRSA